MDEDAKTSNKATFKVHTPDASYLKSNEIKIVGGGAVQIGKLVTNLAKTDPNDVQANAANQIGLLLGYHEIVQAQSRRSFDWALIGVGTGLAFFAVAAGFTIWTGKAVEAIIPVVAGAVIQVMAGVGFYLYNKTSSQMGEFHSRLERLQLYLLANNICQSLQSEQRDKSRADLIREMIMAAQHSQPAEAVQKASSRSARSPQQQTDQIAAAESPRAKTPGRPEARPVAQTSGLDGPV
jgi:hypothetical protein